jgi:hypothetical protein
MLANQYIAMTTSSGQIRQLASDGADLNPVLPPTPQIHGLPFVLMILANGDGAMQKAG